MSSGYRKSQKPHEHRIFALLAPPCTVVHRAPRCIPAAWHRIAPCTTVHHHLCAPAPWCITVVVHRIAPCTTVRDRPCAPALRCISATLHHGARCSTMCDPGTDQPPQAWRGALILQAPHSPPPHPLPTRAFAGATSGAPDLAALGHVQLAEVSQAPLIPTGL